MTINSSLARQIATRLDTVATEIATIQDLLAIALLTQSPAATSGLSIGAAVPRASFNYRWPDGKLCKYADVRKFEVTSERATYSFEIGTEEGGRLAYQRDGRGRIVIFLLEGSGSPRPLVEFAESDLASNLYAAGVPLPGKPRSMATEDHLEQLRRVPHLAQGDLRRTEEVYTSSVRAPSLRIVVGVNDVHLMIEHAYWVGQLRGILR